MSHLPRFAAVIAVVTWLLVVSVTADAQRKAIVNEDSAPCVKCHGGDGQGAVGSEPALVKHWEAGRHAELGIGCADCHGVPAAGKGKDIDNPRYVVQVTWDKATGVKATALLLADGKPVERPDLWRHAGVEMVADVSPRTCAQCHAEASEEFYHSRHSSAAQFTGSIDNFMGRFAEGPAAANNGCQQCHGSVVRVAQPADGERAPRYAADTWPNTGMGRVNADGSWGSCSACHPRHEFSVGVARRPDECGRCHLGPDHPQLEVYQESKHGISYARNEDRMGLDNPADEWVLGKDYTEAPTCATCHMGAVIAHGSVPALKATHDVGARISWTLRPRISIQPPAIRTAEGQVILKGPDDRRREMQQVCLACHSNQWVDSFYVQFDQAVELYNEKYAKPASAIYDHLQTGKILDAVPMNEKMDYVFYELWHHEGRRARHGASMMGPDYVQWHGFYELSRNFYTEFLPLARELGEKAGRADEVNAFIDQTLRGPDGKAWEQYHRWTTGLTDEEKKAMLDWEQQAYGGGR